MTFDLASRVARLPWFGQEYFASRALNMIVTHANPEVARILLSKPRFVDDITPIEEGALKNLFNIAYLDVDAALLSAGRVGDHPGDFDLHFISSVFGIMNDDPDLERWNRLTSQPWFADGLDYEEAALIIVLGDIAGPSDYPGIALIRDRQELYFGFLTTHFTQAETITLPLAGDVNIWVFRRAPFPTDEDILQMIEDVARVGGGFHGPGVPYERHHLC